MHKLTKSRVLNVIIAFTMMIGWITIPTSEVSAALAEHLVISEIYGGGGNNGATLTHDFIELYNPTNKEIDLSGWKVQYASKTGKFSDEEKYSTSLTGVIKSGGYYLIQEAKGNGGSEGLPIADIEGIIAMSGSECKVRLVDNNGEIIDFVGVGSSANEYEAAPTVAMTNSTSVKRKDNDGDKNNITNGWDTDNNSEDFYTSEPTPRNSKYDENDGGTNTPDEDGVLSILEARKKELGTTVKVKGIVTFKEGSGASFNYAIEDGTSGVALRGKDGLNVGDEVIVEGKTSEYNGLVQVAYTLVEKKREGLELPTPKEVTIADIVENNGGENYESQRIKISSVQIGEINTGGNTSITDITTGKSTNLYKVPTLNEIKKDDFVDIIGICSQFNSYQIRVTNANDVVKVDELEPEDKEGPKVTNIAPKANSNIGEGRKPEISATFEDETNVDMTSAKMFVDGVEVTSDLVKVENTIKYTVKESLVDGKHSIKVVVKDTLENETIKEWSFKVGYVESNLYFGQLHSHTTNSDGIGSLDDAYSYAKDNAKLDFFAVTDHSNSFDNDTTESMGDGTTSTKWNNGHAAAEKYTDESFVGTYAYEMTWSNGTGHINTFNTPGFESRNKAEYKESTGLQTYYNQLKNFDDSISQLNHPGSTFGDFNDFAHYDEEIDEVVTLIEVGNGEGPVRGSGYFASYEYYTRALDKGWHIAPTNNQDNHKGKWGNANTARTVILADSLTEEGVYDALRERKTYATEDENLKILYTLNNEAMGSIIDGKPSEVKIKVEVEDPDNEVIGKVSVIVNGGKVLESKEVNSAKEIVEFTLPADYSYYYIRVDQADKDIAVTAPVWVGEVEKAGISKTEADTTMPIKDEEFTITTSLFNNEKDDLVFSAIEYSIDGDVIEKTNNEITVKSLNTSGYSFKYVPTKAGKYNIDIKATATINGVEKVYTDVLKLNVADSAVISRVVIDATHFNDYVAGYYANNMGNFTQIANGESVSVHIENNEITEKMLDETQLLVLTAPAKKSGNANGVAYVPQSFSDEFIAMVKKYVDNGGNIIVCGIADYQDGEGEYASSTQLNKLLEGIGATSRINNDEVVDDDNKVNNQSFRLAFTSNNMDSNILDGVVEGQKYSFYSGCSVSIDKDAYESGQANWLVRGHDTTYSFDSNKNTTGVAVPKGEVIALAEETLAGGGKMYIGGTVFISDFEVKASLDNAGDLQYSNYNIVMNILDEVKRDIPVTPIKDVVNAKEGEVFVIEGTATSGTLEGNAFFDCIYIQDESAGINLFPISGVTIKPGQKLRVVGSVSSYEGERQLNVSSFEVIDTTVNTVEPTKMTIEDSMKSENVGTLIEVTGTVTSVEEKNGVIESFLVKDSSDKEARVFINGYIGYSSEESSKLEEFVKVGATVTAIGLGSVDPEGTRLRVRDRSEIKLASEESNEIEINILHTNDSHGRVVADKSIIGIDTIAAIKDSFENSLLVDAGDTLHGLPFATMNRGRDIVELMKMAGYDLMAPGNHDFNYGYKELLELAELAYDDGNGFEIISANVLKESGFIFKSMKTILNANSIKEIDGVKVGFFGLTSPETTYKTNPNNVIGLEFADPIETAKEQVIALKEAGADIVIALAHIGDDESTEVKSTDIAKAVDGIDVIIDGHSHSKYENGLQVGDTLIVSTGEYEGNLGRLTFVVNSETKKITTKKASLINKAEALEYTPDVEVAEKITEINKTQNEILSEVIGQTVNDLDGERANVRTGETNLGNLLTDAMINTTGADIAITNGGGIRATIKSGDITKGNVIEVLPFGNFIVTKKLTGAQIKEVIEHGIKDAPNVAGQFPHVAGINFVYDPEQEVGNRITSITFDGKALEVDKEYLVATNDFISAGGDGYPHFSSIKTENEFCALDEALADYVKLLGSVNYTVEGRVLTQAQDNIIKVEEVIVEIDKLPEIITLEQKDAVVAARKAYETLTDAQKALVTNLSKLEVAEKIIAELEEEKAEEEANNRAAEEVIAKIDALPEAITLENKGAVVEARKVYEALTDVQKALVTNLSKLEAAEKTIADLEKEEGKDDNNGDDSSTTPEEKPSTSVKPDNNSTNEGSGSNLPQTGGTNTMVIIIIALIIIGIGAIILFRKRNKEAQ